jgi:V/A-type H+-transporting ATPase subunit I
MIRPQPARWFEVIVARDDAFIALEALASTGCVQIESHGVPAPAVNAAPGRAGELLREFAALSRRYRAYWPIARLRLPIAQAAPSELAAGAIARIKRWGEAAEPTIAALQAALADAGELELASLAMREFADSAIDFSQLAAADHGVVAGLFAVPRDAALDVPSDCLARAAEVGAERLLLAVGTPESIEALARSAAEGNGRRARFPDGLAPTAGANLALLQARLDASAARIASLRAALDRLSAQHDLSHALGEVARATWCFEHGGAITGEAGRAAATGDIEVFAHITGWTIDRQALVRAIEVSNARALAAFPAPPRGARPPLTLRNPWWARPFEVFARLVGLPGAGGADPSVLLALIMPLIFGYMFGDVGHGLVLVAAGFALRHRLPVLRLLIPGGLAAAAFGLVFGSVFALEDLIEPLWVLPLAHPLPILVVPLVAGAVLLALGLLIGLLEAWWQHQLAYWLREDAPLLAAYIGVLGGLIVPALWMLALLAALWTMAGAARHAARPFSLHARRRRQAQRLGRSAAGAFAALGKLIERLAQILINTLSFARVGAFALAHAGLESAVVALADAAGNRFGFVLILAIGNLAIIAIEGLVVSIQTTRLVLFEFFTRFYRPEGREFRPLAPPAVSH